MFHSLGLFNKIPCPKQHDCNLQNCIFDHDFTVQGNEPVQRTEYDPFTAGELEQPPAKRRRVGSPLSEAGIRSGISSNQTSVTLGQQPILKSTVHHEVKDAKTPTRITNRPLANINKSAASLPLPSLKRSVSPPPKRDSKVPEPAKVEKLLPRPVAKAPVLLKVRMSLIELLYKQSSLLNSQFPVDDGEAKHHALTEQQIITWVLDEEQQAAAKLGSDIYRNAMSQKVVQLRRMKPGDWKTFVNEKINVTISDEKANGQVSSGLSNDEEVQILRYLRTNLTGLDSHGYVTKAPTATDIRKARDTLKAASGYELCDRCGVRFQVFPGRDDQGRLTTKGECHYHWAKINRGQWQKTDHITGQAQASHPCCGRLTGSEGCTQASTHVFKVADPKRLAALWQFEQTPTKSDGRKRGPVAFDCEMAYTTQGLEMVRITAVSWPQNKALLDVFVRPFGEILDLNTRFSGVTQVQFTQAMPYEIGSVEQDNISAEGEVEPEPLRKVDSPAVARELMFDLLGPDTPLIGHAIDNDLNTCRIIHPFVVDTVLLYPHPRGLPIRYGLKVLTSMHLNRSIQTGGEAGHDSKEDSIATGDLVKVKVKEKWQMMRLQGWRFHNGVLMPPTR